LAEGASKEARSIRIVNTPLLCAQLTFSTKIVGPLLKSKMLSPMDLVTLTSTSRAVLMSVNVQDAGLLIVPLDIYKPSAIVCFFAIHPLILK